MYPQAYLVQLFGQDSESRRNGWRGKADRTPD